MYYHIYEAETLFKFAISPIKATYLGLHLNILLLWTLPQPGCFIALCLFFIIAIIVLFVNPVGFGPQR